ncbi:23S rRNA (adenine(2503)-C(2))-methyltransferase [Wohlfahrtiimonas chitiniclastica]|uniref:Dual-specificity RNA methyltransferase RlmN n=1 Tax=Wohlfahrtiimonas chitiniclastica TaxID=400946 RepID=A0AB35BZE7_9GAMM|nr:23S rRNA (adenine(2503)-C(2))-methyltransferase RlmN [Wohlfahrtiimonas chitiniclastica]MBS7816591.1 23S rRNA (adenine(2503)-C(2))-methyltransferase RlmN [Wohlfahrtiimonas chitiniclastica]MBS7818267.1 23S rRNA (adenine(2503)-C(2))-methyltransferase RlmN [Wohlfahrtiimonas chitiniclastica]MBS7822492.1 23S rRNA (adenine(2503)-C(2))-methyltransferase RlmN [Wohlfahrtiimonas chitiniclastica]MBS7824662.1 23S rRNA (adenine(2503)-C(2))-methyltransferase RlmN [Wohlfahrtiimonas chitiniclastica]MBS78262
MSKEVEKNLYGLTYPAMLELCEEIGEKPYRAMQIMKWVYHKGASSIDDMTDISKKTREKLKSRLVLELPKVLLDKPSNDGTHKWLIQLESGNAIEMVFIPEDDRGTLCVSSQVGCALECSFCSTARQGFNRNLSTAEIVGQVMLAKRLLGEYEGDVQQSQNRRVTNVVLMGMGEPLLNFTNVTQAIDIMLNDYGFGLSKRRVTLSTSGVVPALYRLKEVSDVSLAISLHAPYDTLRNELVPINKKYPLAELLEACKAYITESSAYRKITWEYVMLKDVNDREEDAFALAKLIKDIPGKVNLIPFNPFPNSGYECSSMNRINRFREILQRQGVVTTVRKTRGEDIDAACGQLAGRVNDRTKRTKTTNS